MRTVWKWIIGIVVVLVVLAAVGTGVWVLRGRFAAMPRIVQVNPPNNQNPNTPNVPNTPNGQPPFYGQGPYRQGPYGMMPYGRRGQPMMGGRGFGFGIAPIAAIVGFLFFAGFIVLLVLGIVWLVRSQSRRTVVAATNMAAAVPPVSTAVTTHACKNCGQPIQDGFAYCPNCGAQQ